MKLLDFKIVLAKSLIGKYNSHIGNIPLCHVSRREVLPASVPLHLPVLRQREENVDPAILEALKTKHTFNVIDVEFFCA